jgi:hypothetical protein
MKPTKLQERDRKALRKLEKEGKLNKYDVVEAARDPKSPLHRHFTWSDKRCGELRRADEAMRLVESYRLEIVVVDEVVSTPYYHRDPDRAGNEAGYIALPKLQEDKRLALLTLKMEAERVRSALTRARNIAVALGLKSQLENMLSEIVGKIREMMAA